MEGNVRVGVQDVLNALWGRLDSHERDVGCAPVLEHGDRVGGRSSCCQHRVKQDDEVVFAAGGQPVVVAHRLLGLLVSVHTEVPNAGRR